MGLSIGEVTHGISSMGAEEFRNQLNAKAITETATKIRDIGNILTTFQAGWQGKAEEQFEQKLHTAAEEMAAGLEEIRKALDSEINQIVEDNANFDNNVVGE